MWVLKCESASCTVKLHNIIGRNEIRSFFSSNGWAMMTSDLDSIMEMNAGETMVFTFPNGIKKIEVTKCN